MWLGEGHLCLASMPERTSLKVSQTNVFFRKMLWRFWHRKPSVSCLLQSFPVTFAFWNILSLCQVCAFTFCILPSFPKYFCSHCLPNLPVFLSNNWTVKLHIQRHQRFLLLFELFLMKSRFTLYCLACRHNFTLQQLQEQCNVKCIFDGNTGAT